MAGVICQLIIMRVLSSYNYPLYLYILQTTSRVLRSAQQIDGISW
jgi:hypothetical protein